MNTKMHLLCGISLFLLLITSCSSEGVTIQIYNNGDKGIEDIAIGFTGGTVHIQRMEPGNKISKSINPSGESSLTLSYKWDKIRYDLKLDTYFEPGYSGTIFIVIDSNGKATFRSDLRI